MWLLISVRLSINKVMAEKRTKKSEKHYTFSEHCYYWQPLFLIFARPNQSNMQI